jgi:hypothetical protein
LELFGLEDGHGDEVATETVSAELFKLSAMQELNLVRRLPLAVLVFRCNTLLQSVLEDLRMMRLSEKSSSFP